MIKLVDRYIGRAAVLGILVVWAGMTLLSMMFSVLSELRVMQNDYSSSDVFWFVVLTSPRLAYQVFPISALLGAMVGVGGLAATNELVAFRTSGVSRLRLAVSTLAGTLFLTIPVMMMGEWIAPPLDHRASAFRLSEIVGVAIIGGPRGVWLRDGADIVNIQLPLLSANRKEQSVAFNNVVVYGFSDGDGLKSITRAASASHSASGWVLQRVREVSFDKRGAKFRRMKEQGWATEVRPELLDSAVTRPWRLSLRSLSEYLNYMRENGLDDTVYQAAYWEKIVYPFGAIALVLAGMPFVFGFARNQNLGVRLFLGMMLGGLMMIFNRMVQNFGEAYQVPAVLTYAVPPLLLAAVAVFILRRAV